jgi:peptidoglycan/LPS O-acetylase OafA/YrhL
LLAFSFAFPSPSLVFHYLGLFGLGMVTFQFHERWLSRAAYLALVLAATLAAASAMGPLEAGVGCAAALWLAWGSLLPMRRLAGLGALSYSLYLLHVPVGGRVVNLGSRFATGPASRALVLVSAVAISLGASYLLYRLVELPARRWASGIRYGAANENRVPMTVLRTADQTDAS